MMLGGGGADSLMIGRGSKSSDGGITMSHGGGSSSGASLANGSQSSGPRGSAAAQAQANQQQLASAAQARKRRSSINVYDQPSSLNSRLRQLETDMLRLDEDRTKLFDDTHSALTQYEIKLGEIHAILKSRQDNVEKYVEEMRMLLQAKEEFEKQTKMLNEKHDRIHEKFMHRETIISREIKLLKNKFELLEKNRQFRSLLSQKSNGASDLGARDDSDLISGLDSSDFMARKRSETGTTITTTTTSTTANDDEQGIGKLSGADASKGSGAKRSGGKNVRIRMSKLETIGQIFGPLLKFTTGHKGSKALQQRRQKSNKVASIILSSKRTTPTTTTSTATSLGDSADPRLQGSTGDGASKKTSKNTGGSGVGSLMGRLFNSSGGGGT